MPRYNRYYPDYEQIYSGVEIQPEVMRVLRASDRKMRYMERGIKTERVTEDPATHAVTVLPQREDSLERLIEEDRKQFASADDLEEQVLFRERIDLIRKAVRKLKENYRRILYYRYWKDLTQEEIAQKLSMTQQGVSYLERKALLQLRAMLKENKKI